MYVSSKVGKHHITRKKKFGAQYTYCGLRVDDKISEDYVINTGNICKKCDMYYKGSRK